MVFDTVIYNGMIVTVNPDFDIFDNGAVCILDGKIERIIEGKSGESGLINIRPESKNTIDANGGIIMPGLVNTHTHLPMTLFRGLSDDLSLDEWLNNHMFPAEKKHINADSVKYASLLACAEHLLSGSTTCCDGYFFEDEVASAVRDSGIRAVLGQGVIDFPAPGSPDPSKNVAIADEFAEKWMGVSKMITPSIFCHSPYTCSERTLTLAKEATKKKGILFQIHAAETQAERDRTLAEYKISPIKHLERLGLLDRNTLLVHAIWVDDDDIETIAESGASVSVTTESEMKLASGIAPIPKFLAAGIPVGIGSDGCASNNDQDLFREMDFTAKLHKAQTLDPTIMDARTVLELATIGGAEAIGLGGETGSLEIGKQADIIILDTNKPHLVPMYHPASHLVYAASGSDVRDVMVSGRIIVKDRKLLTLDLEDILARVGSICRNVSG